MKKAKGGTRPRVLIVGGGPAGLVLAIELGRRGVSCILFEEDSTTPTFPKANATTSRTLEHYRRLGFVNEVRVLGLPDDHPTDVSYHTRYSRYELARYRAPTRREALRDRYRNPDMRWPTPEPILRAQQMYIEPVIKRRAEQFEAVDLKFGWRVEKIQQRDNRVYVSAIEATSGITAEFDGDYAVGCDGPRSIVRQTLGISYEGKGAEDRQFMGGRMLATYLDAPALYEIGPNRPSWQYWMLNPERFGVVIAVDGRERFVFHSQLPRDVKGTLEYAEESLRLVVGRDFPHRIIDIAEWTAGFTLVAEHYGSDRIFLAGDAAHLFTPTAGFGYNTAVDDVVNLGWKLAAVCNGWGGSGLLQSYETERKPIGHRNTSFARCIANFFRDLKLPDALEEDSAIGDAQRAEFGKILEDFSRREFNAPGISLGAYYGGSPVVAIEPGEPPKDDPNIYFPTAQPGARAPHLWLSEDRALFDCFGCDFTLLKLNPAKNTVDIENAASARGMPLLVVPLSNTRAQQLYEADLILIRPDQHIAWRGNHPPADPKSLINRVLGFE